MTIGTKAFDCFDLLDSSLVRLVLTRTNGIIPGGPVLNIRVTIERNQWLFLLVLERQICRVITVKSGTLLNSFKMIVFV